MDAGKRAVAFNSPSANWSKNYATENATEFCSVFLSLATEESTWLIYWIYQPISPCQRMMLKRTI